MDNNFMVYDDITLHDELLYDLELCGDNSFVCLLETTNHELFPETVTSISRESLENSNGTANDGDQMHIWTNNSEINDNLNTPLNSEVSDRSNDNFQIPTVNVSPSLLCAEEKKSKIECPLCGKRFAQQSSCNRHKREQHLQADRHHQCNKCGLRFSNKFNLHTHQKRAHANSKQINGLKCPYCSCVYSKAAAIKKHIKNYHNDKEMTNKLSFELSEDNDPQQEAANVLKQLMLLQKDIEEANAINSPAKTTTHSNPDADTEVTSVDELEVNVVTINDRLYPFGEINELKVQQIKRIDGIKYLVCEFCSKEFRKSYGYLRHRRIHCRLRPFICVLCKKSFPTQNQLKRHCFTHKPQRTYDSYKGCYKCPKCFDTNSSLAQFDKHLSSHSPDTAIIFQCRTCNKSYESLRSFFRHKHKFNDPELDVLKSLVPTPLCLVDGEETPTILNAHIPAANYNYQCSVCGLKMSSSISLKHHEKRHRNLNKYQCLQCNGFYASRSSLEVHMKIHSHRRHYICSKCPKVFRTNFQLKRHQLRHSNIKKYKCRYCDEMFKSSQYCRSHMMTHLKKLIKTTNFQQQQKENIVSVQTLIATKNKPQITITEMQIVKNSATITNKSCAKDEKQLPFKCLKCPLKFRYNAWLKKHEAQTHAEERPFKCEICGKTFRKNQVLKTHLLTHGDERSKETCVVCGKKYSSKKSLNVHLRLHTEEKPFNCDLCLKSFRTSGHLIQHRKSNHKDVSE